jgi:hypothetical protein
VKRRQTGLLRNQMGEKHTCGPRKPIATRLALAWASLLDVGRQAEHMFDGKKTCPFSPSNNKAPPYLGHRSTRDPSPAVTPPRIPSHLEGCSQVQKANMPRISLVPPSPHPCLRSPPTTATMTSSTPGFTRSVRRPGYQPLLPNTFPR